MAGPGQRTAPVPAVPVQFHRDYLAEPYLLDVEAMREAAESHAPVGSCGCGGFLFAEKPARGYAGRGPVWVSAVCPNCGHEVAAPDGRLRPRWRHGS